ncbi:hypothetical protein [Rhodobacter sp. SY28-1]|uniref:hypothetical protein n=1 Tax=Rhodobacter sp. SY28-1 TaxID=2562317 RepID=UPI0010C0F3F4|nr:hypothetical protein [Rhodobacter sp. SY28-1]
MNSFEIVRELLLRFAEVDRSTADAKTLLLVNRFSLVIFSSGIHKDRRSLRPDLLEADLEAIRKQIQELVNAISDLDPWVVQIVRLEGHVARRVAAGVSEDVARRELLDIDTTKDEWIDSAAISLLTGLKDALKEPIQRLIHEGRSFPSGKGRKPDLVARKVAYYAGLAICRIGQSRPTYRKGSTKFAKFCEALFDEFSISSDCRRACEWALSEMQKSGEF